MADRVYGDARDDVAQEMQSARFDQVSLHKLLDLMGPQEDEDDTWAMWADAQTTYPNLAFDLYYRRQRAGFAHPLPEWDEFVATWGTVIHWEAPFMAGDYSQSGKYDIITIVTHNYEQTAGLMTSISVPATRYGERTKAARKTSAQLSGARIVKALEASGGNHKAAARLLWKKK